VNRWLGKRVSTYCCGPQHGRENPGRGNGQFGPAHAPDEEDRQKVGVHLHQMGQKVAAKAYAHAIVGDPRLQEPAAGSRVAQGFLQQLAQEPEAASRPMLWLGMQHSVRKRDWCRLSSLRR
jgi:hypothetical protein